MKKKKRKKKKKKKRKEERKKKEKRKHGRNIIPAGGKCHFLFQVPPLTRVKRRS